MNSLFGACFSFLRELEDLRRCGSEAEGLRVCRHAPLLMEWALLEAEEGNEKIARELFCQGAAAGQPHAPLLAAWAAFEEQAGRCAHMPVHASRRSQLWIDPSALEPSVS